MFGTIKMRVQSYQRIILGSLILVAVLGWLLSVTELFLAHSGVNYVAKDTFVNRHLYRISGLFYEHEKAGRVLKTKTATQSYATLNAWKLQAVYQEENRGFAVVVIANKSYFVNLSESLQGYTLEKIESKSAYFLRNGKRFKLSLDTVGSKVDAMIQSEPSDLNIKELNAGIITRKEVNRRINNPKLIWSEINISVFIQRSQFKGFVVRNVKKGSIFEHLGLKRSDIIVSANGEPLDSIEKVQTLYKNIDNINALVLGVQRDDQIEELKYEIK